MYDSIFKQCNSLANIDKDINNTQVTEYFKISICYTFIYLPNRACLCLIDMKTLNLKLTERQK